MLADLKYSVEWYIVGENNIRFKEFPNFNSALTEMISLEKKENISSARLIVTHLSIKR